MEVGSQPTSLSGRLGVAAVPRAGVQTSGQFGEAAERLVRNPGAVLGGIVLVILVLVAIFAPILAPYDPIQPQTAHSLRSPSIEHLLGTDPLGRDILSRIIHGARVSLMQGALAVLLAGSIGVTLGLLAAYYAGWVDALIMRFIDVLMTFPSILLALVVLAVLGPNLLNTMLAIGIAWVPNYARITRGAALAARQNQYVEAAQIIGSSDLRIMLRHILPNIAAPLIVLATLGMAFAILIGASLSFIGLGAQPPTPEWGAMAADGRNYLRSAWWVSTFPGLAVMITVLSINLFGDGLRDALDPRMKKPQ